MKTECKSISLPNGNYIILEQTPYIEKGKSLTCFKIERYDKNGNLIPTVPKILKGPKCALLLLNERAVQNSKRTTKKINKSANQAT